jgi:hypothetical protein
MTGFVVAPTGTMMVLPLTDIQPLMPPGACICQTIFPVVLDKA